MAMATQGRPEDPHVGAPATHPLHEVMGRLYTQPWRFRFFQAVRLLEQTGNPVGRYSKPGTEVVRFGVWQSLVFPASEVQGIDTATVPPRMFVNFMGLTGACGALPHVYTELAAERLSANDSSLADFLDIFNHRVISLFYRAWARGRLPVERERFDGCLRSLTGIGTHGLRDRLAVPDDALLYYSGLLSLQPRSAVALERILAEYLDVPVAIEQFIGEWCPLPDSDLCRFEERHTDAERLGVGTVVGDAVWNQQSRARIRLGPLTIEQYSSFLPGSRGFRLLSDWTRFFSRGEVGFELQLVLKRDEVPACRLNDDGGIRLGWTSWMKTGDAFPRDPRDTVIPLDQELT